MKINVGVIAASGYAGGEAVRLLSSHPNVNLNHITSRRLISKFFHSIYPNLRNISNLKFEDYDVNKAKEKCDIVFLGTPHGISQDMVPELLEADLKVIDLKEYVDILSGVERRFNNRAWILINLAKGREGSFEPSVKGRKRKGDKPIEMEEYEL